MAKGKQDNEEILGKSQNRERCRWEGSSLSPSPGASSPSSLCSTAVFEEHRSWMTGNVCPHCFLNVTFPKHFLPAFNSPPRAPSKHLLTQRMITGLRPPRCLHLEAAPTWAVISDAHRDTWVAASLPALGLGKDLPVCSRRGDLRQPEWGQGSVWLCHTLPLALDPGFTSQASVSSQHLPCPFQLCSANAAASQLPGPAPCPGLNRVSDPPPPIQMLKS